MTNKIRHDFPGIKCICLAQTIHCKFYHSHPHRLNIISPPISIAFTKRYRPKSGIYLAESEQRSCALAAATAFNGILCTAAGGYLVERLPDCPPETMTHMEKNLATLVAMDGSNALPTNLLLEGKTPLDIAKILLDGLGIVPLGQVEPKALCECSEEKLFRSLRLLPREEVDQIIREEGKVEARCQFCGKVYRMGPEEVKKRFQEATGDPSKDE